MFFYGYVNLFLMELCFYFQPTKANQSSWITTIVSASSHSPNSHFMDLFRKKIRNLSEPSMSSVKIEGKEPLNEDGQRIDPQATFNVFK